jgi:uncharacterized protein
VKNIFAYVTKIVEGMPKWVILAVVILSLAAIPGAILIKTDSSLDPLVQRGSTVSADTQRYQEKFGADPLTLVLAGSLQDIFSTANLAVLSRFEQEFPAANNCYIISPITILNQAVQKAAATQQALQTQIAQAQQQAAQAAREQAAAAGLDEAAQEQAAARARAQVLQQFQSAIDQLKQIGEPGLNNPNFVAAVLYNADGTINSALASLVPDQSHALIIVTPTGNNNGSDTLKTSQNAENYFKTNPLPNVTVTAVGYALVTDEISSSMKRNLLILLGLAVVVMVVVLFALFRVRWRLLSLLLVGIGALWTFGLMGYISIPFTMATMAVLPVLIGLGIDYPIQFHNRYQEELTRSKSVTQAVATSFMKMAPAVGIALLATAVGFATLYISTIPMIRDFGIILVVGVVVCYLIALFLLYSTVFLADRRVPVARLCAVSTQAGNRIERFLGKIAGFTLKYPLGICIAAAMIGIAGGVIDHWLPVNTDYNKLIPQNLTSLQNAESLNGLLGVGGHIQFMVEADDVTSQAFLEELQTFVGQEIAIHPDLINTNNPAFFISSAAGGSIPAQAQIDQILANSPPALVRQQISADKKMAALSFGTQNIPLSRIHDLITAIEQDGQKMPGVYVGAVGSSALSAATIDSVINSRFLMDGLCLAAIFIILLLIYRRFTRAFFIIACIGIVIGWSSLAMLIVGIPLNPLTAILGVITTAIGAEFMVLLASRYEEEKANGELPRQAMLTAVSKMGRAIVTTGVTTLGGFGVLIASSFPLVRDFGIATVVGIFLCLISAIGVMPTLMVWWDERGWRRAAKR